MFVNWTSVSIADGNITGYRICYQLTAGVNCSGSNVKNKTVTESGITSTIITGLNEYTEYYVAAAVVTTKGVGPTGRETTGTTNQDSKYAY